MVTLFLSSLNSILTIANFDFSDGYVVFAIAEFGLNNGWIVWAIAELISAMAYLF